MANILMRRLRRKRNLELNVKSGVSYCDTLVLWWKHKPPQVLRDILYRHYQNSFYEKVRIRPVQIKDNTGVTVFIGFRVTCHQPQIKTLTYLKEIHDARQFSLTQVHIAVDFPGTLNLNLHVLQKYRREGNEIHVEDNTTYFKSRDSRRNIAVYEDQPSKVTGTECSHLEIRFNGSDAVKRIGINFDDLIEGVPVIEVLSRTTKLGYLDEKKLAAFIESLKLKGGRGWSGYRSNKKRRKIESLLLRATQTNDRTPAALTDAPAQSLCDGPASLAECVDTCQWRDAVDEIKWHAFEAETDKISALIKINCFGHDINGLSGVCDSENTTMGSTTL